jgi:hypothetical protein
LSHCIAPSCGLSVLDSFKQEHLLQDYIGESIDNAREHQQEQVKMTILSNSWAQHLNSLAGNNEANKNMTAFMEALAPSTTTSKQLNSLVEEVDAAVLLVGPNNLIHRTHSWAKFGGTQSHPITLIVCLIGMGPRADAITVDHKQAVALTTTSIPSSTEITNCKTIDDFVNLSINMTATVSTMAAAAITATPPTARTTSATTTTANATVVPAITTTGRRITRRNTGAVTGAGAANTPTPSPAAAPIIQSAAPTSQTIELILAFVMAPFLCTAIFNKKTSDPLELIILA